MARATIVTLLVGKETAEPAATALPAEGGQFTPAPGAMLRLTNTSTVSARTVTMQSRFADNAPLGLSRDHVISLAPGEVKYVRFESFEVVQPDGTAYIDVDAAADVTALLLVPAHVSLAASMN